jgi:phenylacetate 2-hydroxylase
MNASFNSTSDEALHVINGVRESRIVYTFAAITLAAVVLSSFEDGRKFLQRIVQFLDGMLGGAPHIVTLPGPPGLPLVGNLLQVSCLYKSSVDSSNRCV